MSGWFRPPVSALLPLAIVGALTATGALSGPGLLGSPAATHPAVSGLPAAGSAVRVIVQARPGQAQQAAVALRSAGAQIGRSLPIVDGFAAQLPAGAVQRLAADPAIRRVTPDTAVHFSSLSTSAAPVAGNYPTSTGARTAWSRADRGGGVTVAVIDTGIAPVADLAGRVVAGPDFSGEGDSRADTYGHGTVMAGIIAGDGASSAGAAGGAYVGMAPAARLLSVKVAGRNGATDVSTVLAAMQWVGSYASTYGIRVLNLAWGTTSHQSPAVDPLNFAVERLWRSGIVVVAAAGNGGPAGGTVTKPGDDPLVITAGAYDDRLNALISDDTVPAWSSRGPTAAGFAKPDLVAPGRSIVATKSPGSYVDTTFPEARIGSAYIRGSGTSQATAVVSGGVALMLSSHGRLTPDQVKFGLAVTSLPISGAGRATQGRGRLWLPVALNLQLPTVPGQQFSASGRGSIEQSRGGRHVETVCAGTQTVSRIAGEQDALCQPWNSDSWTSDSWTSDSWTASSWSSNSWTSDSWTSDSWTSDSWTSSFQTAFWGDRTPWWNRIPGEPAQIQPARPRAMARLSDHEDGHK